MRKQFYVSRRHLFETGAYLPPTSDWHRGRALQGLRKEIKRIACELAHRVLKHWGRTVYGQDERVETVTLPPVETLLESIRQELLQRVSEYGIRPEDLALVCGMGVPHELWNNPEAYDLGNALELARQTRGGGHEFFGCPVVATPWLGDREFVLLPLEYLRTLAQRGVLRSRR